MGITLVCDLVTNLIKGNYISKLCSFSSSFKEIVQNFLVFYNSSIISLLTYKFPKGVSSSSDEDKAHPLKYFLWEGPRMKIFSTSLLN